MKEMELRKHATCALCGNRILASGIPLFWRVTVERFGVDLRALERQQGRAMMFNGNATLAYHMGPDEDMAKPLMPPVVLTVCEPCVLSSQRRLAELAQAAMSKQEAEEGNA
jgi:hypothetical protein